HGAQILAGRLLPATALTILLELQHHCALPPHHRAMSHAIPLRPRSPIAAGADQKVSARLPGSGGLAHTAPHSRAKHSPAGHVPALPQPRPDPRTGLQSSPHPNPATAPEPETPPPDSEQPSPAPTPSRDCTAQTGAVHCHAGDAPRLLPGEAQNAHPVQPQQGSTTQAHTLTPAAEPVRYWSRAAVLAGCRPLINHQCSDYRSGCPTGL